MTKMTLQKLLQPPILPLRIPMMCTAKSGGCVHPKVEFKSGVQNWRVIFLCMTLRVKTPVGSPPISVIDVI